jgi:hypothetical protein
MMQIKTLAPTLIDAIAAVEAGCRRGLNDPHFVFYMANWMKITENVCFGCLATATIMQLTNKSGKDILDCFTAVDLGFAKEITDRAAPYNLYREMDGDGYTDLSDFEHAIDSLRHNELFPLLHFYNLGSHPNAKEAGDWFYSHQKERLGYGVSQADLINFADFLRNILAPKLNTWFSA